MTVSLARDAGPLSHVREGAVAVVVEEVVPLAVRVQVVVEQVRLDEDVEAASPRS